MITLHKIPLKAKPLHFLSLRLLNINSSRTAVLVPTKRNQRILASLGNWELDIQTVSEFTRRANLYGRTLLPRELRQYYLYKAFSTSKLSSVLMDDSLPGLMKFVKSSSAILPFYRELAAEQIDPEKLKAENTYTDYEEQINGLLDLWQDYCKILDEKGYMDEWEHYKKPLLDEAYINRYDRFVFIVSGYLNNYEISQLKNISSQSKSVDIYLNYVEESHPQQTKLEREFECELKVSEDDGALFWKAAETMDDLLKCNTGNAVAVIYKENHLIKERIHPLPYEMKKGVKTLEVMSCASSVAQYDLITRNILDRHFNHQVPLGKIAVILPSPRMVPWFTHTDRFLLYNVSAGHLLHLFPFFNHLQNIYEAISEMDGELLRIDRLKAVLTDYSFAGSSYMDKLTSMQEHGTLYIHKNMLAPELGGVIIPFTGQATYAQVCSDMKGILEEILKNRITGGNFYLKMEIEGIQKMMEELEKLQYLYKPFADVLSAREVMGEILRFSGNLAVPMVKGKVAVIGLLESRNLQYDYIYIPDLNSDVFPVTQRKDYYLNSTLRKKLHLPTVSDRDNLQKSYIYQIAARAEATLITYTKSEDMQPSSVVNEILAQSGALILDRKEDRDKTGHYDPELYINFPFKAGHKISSVSGPIAVTPEIRKQMLEMFYSHARLKTLRECPLKFFYKYIKKLYTVNEPVEDADMRVLGECLHNVMETLYKEKVDATMANYLPRMRELFDRYIAGYDYFTKNAVGKFQADALKERFDKLAAQERVRLENGAEIVGFEIKRWTKFSGINIEGYIDRLDRTAAGYSIIDYKYQNLEESTKFDDFKEMELQLPIYALLVEGYYNELPAELLWFDLKGGSGFIEGFPADKINIFKAKFTEFIEQNIFQCQHFNSTQDAGVCKYCPYNTFCHNSLYIGESFDRS